MSNKTKIEWATHSWNPYTWNCSKISAGCKNCYALRNARRFAKNANGGDFLKYPPILRQRAFAELKKLPAGAVVFVNSHSDTFHEGILSSAVVQVCTAMATRPDVQFLVLTKRPERAAALRLTWYPNIWLGTSVESQKHLQRLDALLSIPAAGHFLSAEPLLEPLIGITPYLRPTTKRAGLKWVIVGGESDPSGDYRPFDKQWASFIQMRCANAGVPFLFKQSSGRHSGLDRELDGKLYDELPQFVLGKPSKQMRLL